VQDEACDARTERSPTLASEQLLLQVKTASTKVSTEPSANVKVAQDLEDDDEDVPEDDMESFSEDTFEDPDLSPEEAEAESRMLEMKPDVAGEASVDEDVEAQVGNTTGPGLQVAWPSWCNDAVRRRRRYEAMGSCRRRHSSPGYKDSDSPTDKWQCDEATNQMKCHATSGHYGWPAEGPTKANGLWCKINYPPPEWHLKSCPGDGSLSVKLLTYNLFWWNLFNKHGGGERSAGRLIARTAGAEQYDFMAFQECDDRWRILDDARQSGLTGEYGTVDGGKAIAIAYRKSRWTLLSSGNAIVGEDGPRQYYGNRSVAWGRFQHVHEDKTVFFVNHHGPLKVGERGGCTGSATALHIMKVIAEHAFVQDAIILTGDFNARKWSTRIRELSKRLTRVISGWGPPMWGIDHVFTNCGEGGVGKILGKGDGAHKSDHDAITATLRI